MKSKKLPIPSKLLAKVKKEDIERFKQDYSEANFVLEVIKEAVEEELNSLLTKEESDMLFAEPGYAAHYAHLMGQRKALRKIINLLPKR